MKTLYLEWKAISDLAIDQLEEEIVEIKRELEFESILDYELVERLKSLLFQLKERKDFYQKTAKKIKRSPESKWSILMMERVLENTN